MRSLKGCVITQFLVKSALNLSKLEPRSNGLGLIRPGSVINFVELRVRFRIQLIMSKEYSD